MADLSFLGWPFFDDTHRVFARELSAWALTELGPPSETGDVGAESRALVRRYGAEGWLRHTVPAAYGGVHERLDIRTICLARETLGAVSGLADFAFAMQGLGSGAITLFGSDALRRRYLPEVARGTMIPAFAISEREAGSDVASMTTVARLDGDAWVLDGEKTWISNAGIADIYVVFARLAGDDPKRFGAFVVEADAPGFRVSEQIPLSAPHPLGTIVLEGCRVPREAAIGDTGRGLRVALGTLDVFRSTVGAAALGFARRALAEATLHAAGRRAFGGTLSDLQLVQEKLADMATAVDASALLVYRAAWAHDTGTARVTREAAMAKLFATESAQRVIDDAVQLFGGRGVVRGETVERLYREIRALRIYEGASEVQKIVIAGQVIALDTRTERR